MRIHSRSSMRKRRLVEEPSLLLPRPLLAEVLLAVRAPECGAGRTGKVIASCVGLPVAAAMAVAVVVVVAVIIVIEGTERRGRDGACRCNRTPGDGTRCADR